MEFPACAGMSRTGQHRKMDVHRVPRVCGDEPYAEILTEEGEPEFPACAGMSRASCLEKNDDDGVPRVCGDEPWRRSSGLSRTWSSPRVRG